MFFFQTTVRSDGSSSLFVLVFQWPFGCKKKKKKTQHRALISCLVRVCLIPSRESFLLDALLLTSLLVPGLPLQAFILREPPNPGGIRASAVQAVPSFPATPPRESQGLWHRNLGLCPPAPKGGQGNWWQPPCGIGAAFRVFAHPTLLRVPLSLHEGHGVAPIPGRWPGRAGAILQNDLELSKNRRMSQRPRR